MLHEIDSYLSICRYVSLLTSHVESRYLNSNVCQFESSQEMKAEPNRLTLRKLTASLRLNLFHINCTTVLTVDVFHGL